jgi:hypothetical protein
VDSLNPLLAIIKIACLESRLSVNIFVMTMVKSSHLGLPSRQSKNWSTDGIRGYVMLQVEFLRLSPSYALAHAYASSSISIEELHQKIIENYEIELGAQLQSKQKGLLISEFDAVLKTYAEFGNLTTIDFGSWWFNKGINLFEHEHYRPKVHKVAQLEKDSIDTSSAVNSLKGYFETQYQAQGSPATLVVSIPLGISRRTLLTQVSKLIESSGVEVVAKAKKAKRPFSAKRLRSEPLFCYMAMLLGKAIIPQATLWQLGIKANVSPKHSQGLKITDKNTAQTTYQRQVLAILASRALKKAKLVAENAAFGEFPSVAKRQLTHFDWDEIYSRIRLKRTNLKPRKPKA